MTTPSHEQSPTDGLRNLAARIKEAYELAEKYADLPADDFIIEVSDNDEDPYVTAWVQDNALIDIEISPDVLTDFDTKEEVSILISSVVLQAFLEYRKVHTELGQAS